MIADGQTVDGAADARTWPTSAWAPARSTAHAIGCSNNPPAWYWIIGDDMHAYRFFPDDNGRFYRSRPRLEDFPRGFDEPVAAMREANPEATPFAGNPNAGTTDGGRTGATASATASSCARATTRR
jgi:hypothetical protein